MVYLNVHFHCSGMRSFTGDKCPRAPAVQGIFRSERGSVEHCSPFGVSLYAWQLWGLLTRRLRGGPWRKGELPIGLDICIPEALEWVFIMGWLCALSAF